MKPAGGVSSRKILLALLSICFLVALDLTRLLPAHVNPAPVQDRAAGAIRQFPLKYEENTSISTRLVLGQQEVRFRKEPAFGRNDKIVRRALRTGPNDEDYMGFAVNLTTRMLYLDLNLNLDLTDDPTGVYSSASVGGVNTSSGNAVQIMPISFFRGVRLALHNGGVERAYLLEPFYVLNENMIAIGVRSCYQGEVEIGGKTWLFQVQDNLDGRFDAQDKFLLTNAAQRREPISIPNTAVPLPANVAQRGVPISIPNTAMPLPANVVQRGVPINIFYAAMPLPQDLFAGGRLYRTKVAFVTGTSSPAATVTFEERSTPMSELALEGQFIHRLVLQGKAGLVMVDEPGQRTRLPAGDYSIQNAYLQKTPGTPVLVATRGKSSFTAPAGAACKVRVGAPFASLVAAERRGNMLQLSYILRGSAGEEYTISLPDRNNPPKFVIYLMEKVVASGSFQFG